MAFEFDDSIDLSSRMTIVGLGTSAHEAIKQLEQEELPGRVTFITLKGEPLLLSKAEFHDGPGVVCLLCELASLHFLAAVEKIAALAKLRGALVFALIRVPGQDCDAPFSQRNHIIETLQHTVDFPVIFCGDRCTEKFVLGGRMVCEWLHVCGKDSLIALDFADIMMLAKQSGLAMVGIGCSEGTSRAKDAAEQALGAGLLQEVDISSAQGVLVSIAASPSITPDELEQVSQIMHHTLAGDAGIFIGLDVDEKYAQALWVTTLFAGIQY